MLDVESVRLKIVNLTTLLYQNSGNAKNSNDVWVKVNGIGLMDIINELVIDKYSEPINDEEYYNNFYKSIELLQKTDYPNIDHILKSHLPGGIEQEKYIKTPDGRWDYVNKLNTSFTDLSNLIKDLLIKMLNESEPRIVKLATNFCNSILSTSRNDRIEMLEIFERTGFKKYLKKLLKHYYKSLDDYRQFTERIKQNTIMGDESEDEIEERLRNSGYDVLFRGGEGDRIDMYFGVDMIVYKKDVGYKTIQIKAFKPNHNEYKKINVDWLCIHNKNRGLNYLFQDVKSKQFINIYQYETSETV